MLKPNHIKALQLLKENAGSVAEIAKACGLSTDHLYDLIEASPKVGQLGILFSQEYKKAVKECSKRTRDNLHTLKDRLVSDLLRWNQAINDKKPDPSKWQLKEVNAKRAVLAEINKVSDAGDFEDFFKTGLAGEDLVNEFKRVRSLVEFAANGATVQSSDEGGPGILHLSAEAEARGAEAQEAPELPAQPEAGALSQVGKPHQVRSRRKPVG